MQNKLIKAALALTLTTITFSNSNAAISNKAELQDLKNQLQDLKIKISKIEEESQKKKDSPTPFAFGNNAFNPQIGVVLNGKYINSTNNDPNNKIAGFGLGEGSSGNENKGFSLGESEISLSSNVDDLFKASINLAVEDEGIEVEEAYIQTLKLPYSLNLKAGRFLADIGYLNQIHTHHDNFANRPLPYQAFLDGHYNDDGVQLSWVAPTPFYLEAVVGGFSGNKFPAGGREGNNGAGAYSFSLKTGGDLSNSSAFVTGISYLGSKMGSGGRQSADGDNTLDFKGQSDLYIAHLKYNWSPNGNNLQRELILQGEYFLRKESGTYESLDEAGSSQGSANFNGSQSGWYAEAVYKFLPKWRAGYRYSQLNATSSKKINLALANTALNSNGLNSSSNSYMVDFTNSEFSRIRFQYDQAKQIVGDKNETFTLQYIMVLGAHPAHKF